MAQNAGGAKRWWRKTLVAQNAGKSDFLHYFNSFNRNWGWRSDCFILKENVASMFLEN